MGRGHDSTSVDVSQELASQELVSEELVSDEVAVGAVSEDFEAEADETLTSTLRPTEEGEGQSGLPAAFELIAEACAAVKIAEDRASLAEVALEDATLYYTGQIENLTKKLNVADRRVEMAERQVALAEERLRIFCQTILTTMHNI